MTGAVHGTQGTLTRCVKAGSDSKGTAQACTDPASPRRLSYDPTRYPRLLPEAYCLCRGCLTGPRGEEDLSLRSAPVLLPTVVLRRTAGCAGGRSVYAEEYVAVPVGCTCVPAPDHDAPAATETDRGGRA